MSPLEGSLAERARYLVSHPNDEAALSALCAALRDGGQVEQVIGLLEVCSNAERAESLPDHAMAELTFRIAKKSTAPHARELCRAALDRYPVHVAALSLFAQLADASWTDELCARYQIFLEDAPLHGVARDICKAVTSKLVEAQREATARHDERRPPRPIRFLGLGAPATARTRLWMRPRKRQQRSRAGTGKAQKIGSDRGCLLLCLTSLPQA